MIYDVEKNFIYHPPKTEQIHKYEELRTHAKAFARLILVNCPESRERDLALSYIEQSLMWANASIARNE